MSPKVIREAYRVFRRQARVTLLPVQSYLHREHELERHLAAGKNKRRYHPRQRCAVYFHHPPKATQWRQLVDRGSEADQRAIDANSGPNAAMALRTAASSPPKS
jgi:hypothetical protein